MRRLSRGSIPVVPEIFEQVNSFPDAQVFMSLNRSPSSRGTMLTCFVGAYGSSPAVEKYRTHTQTPSCESPDPKSEAMLPIIITNMNWRIDWNPSIDPGAWHRLIMNLFGNALKYTETGYIQVSLNSRDSPISPDGTSSSMIILSVSDSGRGISKEFLKHHLHKPFAQEDTLAVGSGLGMSIVWHIVDDFGVYIDIGSEPVTGTEVTISIPLCSASLSSADKDDAMS